MIRPPTVCGIGTLALLITGLYGAQTTDDRTVPRDIQGVAQEAQGVLRSEVLSTDAGERILLEQIVLRAPVAEVWKAYTTSDGWEAWSSPRAAIDLSVGGEIRTSYDPDSDLAGDGVNRMRILNYVPETLLTLQADLAEGWPEILRKDADRLSNVILFDALDEETTRVRSFGIGYTQSAEMDKLLESFKEWNSGLYIALREYVEAGTVRDWTR